MRLVCLVLITFFFLHLSTELKAAIKNGYAVDVEAARKSLACLENIYLSGSRTVMEERRIRERMAVLTDHIRLYEVTETYLIQFRALAPELYNAIDTLRDKAGRTVDIYVKIILPRQLGSGVYGITNMEMSGNDADGYSSEYGANTVSVRVSEDAKCLRILAHELGHVYYQVPNLAVYREYYASQYLEHENTSNSYGHYTGDLSGNSAKEFEKRFLASAAGKKRSL